jgi:hypothetical protein
MWLKLVTASGNVLTGCWTLVTVWWNHVADEWSLFNNGETGIIQVAASDRHDIIILDEASFEQWQIMVTN